MDCAGIDSWSSLLSISGEERSLCGSQKKGSGSSGGGGWAPKRRLWAALEERWGWVGARWSREDLTFLCNLSPTSSCNPVSLGRKRAAGSPRRVQGREEALQGGGRWKWKWVVLVSLWNGAILLCLVCILLHQLNCLNTRRWWGWSRSLKFRISSFFLVS